MTPEQFAYWLQGFVELNPQAMLTLTQWQVVKDHLALVHRKVTPVRMPNLVPPGSQYPFLTNPPAIMC